jgi:hypothetical protein
MPWLLCGSSKKTHKPTEPRFPSHSHYISLKTFAPTRFPSPHSKADKVKMPNTTNHRSLPEAVTTNNNKPAEMTPITRSRLPHVILRTPPLHPSVYFPPIMNTRMQREISAAWHKLYNECFTPHNCVQNPHKKKKKKKKIGDGVLEWRPKGGFVLREPLVVREKRGGEDGRVRYARDMIETMGQELEACQGGKERRKYCFPVVRCDGVVADISPRPCRNCAALKAECADMREELDLVWKLFDIVQDSERKWIADVQRMEVKAHTKTCELGTLKKELEKEKEKCKEYEETNAGLMHYNHALEEELEKEEEKCKEYQETNSGLKHYNDALEEELEILRDVIKALKEQYVGVLEPHGLGGDVSVGRALEGNGVVDLKTEDEDEEVEMSVLSPSTVWYEWWRGVKDLLWQCFKSGSSRSFVIGLLVGVVGVALCFLGRVEGRGL